MSIESWAALIVSICTIVAFAAGSVKWLVKHYFAEIKAEMKPNGGSSMRDEIKQTKLEVKEIKDRQNEADQMRRDMDKKLDRMYEILINHVANNSK
jgi:hypothetical protein